MRIVSAITGSSIPEPWIKSVHNHNNVRILHQQSRRARHTSTLLPTTPSPLPLRAQLLAGPHHRRLLPLQCPNPGSALPPPLHVHDPRSRHFQLGPQYRRISLPLQQYSEDYHRGAAFLLLRMVLMLYRAHVWGEDRVS